MTKKGVDVSENGPRSPELGLWDSRSNMGGHLSMALFSKNWALGAEHFRPLGIEKGIEKAKENIRSKGVTRGSQEVESRAPCGRMVHLCVRMCPWERFGTKSAQTRASTCYTRALARVKSQSCTFCCPCICTMYRVTARYRLAESKLRLKLEFQVFRPGPSPFEAPIRHI
ncbi:hypothetical protein PIB30_098373 [Stylosanthes scabra]|uniref:Uncharacterized protein n=1 Tax=Stylosanthes scabra TaxID=79078 RepID=A0ABU6ZVD6_9FABA|nr:hypothetical protein [Stylosanthes scabra]